MKHSKPWIAVMRRISRRLRLLLITILVTLVLLTAWLWPRNPYAAAITPPFTLERIGDTAIVDGDSHPSLSPSGSEGGYVNIASPTVLRAPAWLTEPPGQYFLYFAHHKGRHIRVAYADSPLGPWRIDAAGSLRLEDSGLCDPSRRYSRETRSALEVLRDRFATPIVRDYLRLAYQVSVRDASRRKARGIAASAAAAPHIASPDLTIDEDRRQIRMTFHGLCHAPFQFSGSATSSDGVNFTAAQAQWFATYLRSFRYRGREYLLGMPGMMYRRKDGDAEYEARDHLLFDYRMRHAGLWVEGDILHVLWSRVGDAPESILYSQVALTSDDWNEWIATEGVVVMTPERRWEGATLEVQRSLRGELQVPARELRDPYLFIDDDGERYLYYVGGGERAIGVARMTMR